MKRAKIKAVEPKPLLKLDIGCGPNKRPGFTGVDRIAFPGVDVVTSLTETWPFSDESVEEINASHVMEHFTQEERCFIYNEMGRVLIHGGKCTIVVPHWASNRAYGDPTHKWPPYSEMHFYYLLRSWRDANAPHTNELLRCDFDVTWGYGLRQDLLSRNAEFQQFALQYYKEAAQDIISTLVKRA